MRRAVFLAAALAASAAAEAPSPPEVHFDVPQDKGPQQVTVTTREFPVGGSSGWHIHAGVEIGQLVSGQLMLEQEGRPARRLSPGDSMIVPRGVAHNGVNIGSVPARLAITFVTDKDTPLRTPVPPPGAHAGH